MNSFFDYLFDNPVIWQFMIKLIWFQFRKKVISNYYKCVIKL